MAVYGHRGKLLEINLRTGKSSDFELNEEDAKNFVGGRGLGAKILWDRIRKPGVDALSPENPLLVMSGVLSGFGVTAAARTVVVTKSPHTSAISSPYPKASTLCYTNFGGHIGPEIKFAGYDGLIVTGKASEPVYLCIQDDEVEIRPAKHLWGKGTDETDKMLREELENPRFRSMCIGPAGENLVEYACVISESARAAGRCGAGCVMGSKNLKAISVRGTGMPEVADLRAFHKACDEAKNQLMNWSSYEAWRRWGTARALTWASDNGRQAVKNYREGTFLDIDKIGPVAAERELWVKHHGCFYCPIGCRRAGFVRKGEYAGLTHDGPEYETGTMLGANCLVNDMGAMMKAIGVADDLGLDAISIGNVLGFLMESYEKGIIDSKFLEGTELAWGNIPAMLHIMEKTARREGVGELLSKGVKAIAAEIKGGSEAWAIHTKGQEWAAWNAHAYPTQAICYATANRGGCHLSGHDANAQNNNALIDSLGLCRFPFGGIGPSLYVAIINAITGWHWKTEDYLRTGERIYNLEKCFMVRDGFRRQDDTVAERFFTEPLTLGPKKGAVLSKEEFEKGLDAYYKSRQWDVKTSLPTIEKMNDLGLNYAAKDLSGLGVYAG